MLREAFGMSALDVSGAAVAGEATAGTLFHLAATCAVHSAVDSRPCPASRYPKSRGQNLFLACNLDGFLAAPRQIDKGAFDFQGLPSISRSTLGESSTTKINLLAKRTAVAPTAFRPEVVGAARV